MRLLRTIAKSHPNTSARNSAKLNLLALAAFVVFALAFVPCAARAQSTDAPKQPATPAQGSAQQKENSSQVNPAQRNGISSWLSKFGQSVARKATGRDVAAESDSPKAPAKPDPPEPKDSEKATPNAASSNVPDKASNVPDKSSANSPEKAPSDSKDVSGATKTASAASPDVTPNVPKSKNAELAPEYRIGEQDVLQITVWREPDFSGPVQVRPDGKITVPLIGDLQAIGVTTDTLARRISDALEEFVTDPKVTVGLQQANNQHYTISGMVEHPGSFPMNQPIRVLDAINRAGGPQTYANTKKVVIVRGPQRIRFNYRDVLKGNSLEQNIWLENGDTIIVP